MDLAIELAEIGETIGAEREAGSPSTSERLLRRSPSRLFGTVRLVMGGLEEEGEMVPEREERKRARRGLWGRPEDVRSGTRHAKRDVSLLEHPRPSRAHYRTILQRTD